MTRLALLMVAVVGLFGCATKPSEGDCRQAITNMQNLMGTENLRQHELVESQVRRCKGGSSKKSVQCAIKATTLAELRKCDFYKVPEKALGIGPGGSAAGSAGSAAGSAGSAAGSAGSAAGSAAPPAGSEGSAGSAAGSAGSADTTAGSAAPGSAAPGAGATSGSAK